MVKKPLIRPYLARKSNPMIYFGIFAPSRMPVHTVTGRSATPKIYSKYLQACLFPNLFPNHPVNFRGGCDNAFVLIEFTDVLKIHGNIDPCL